MGISLLTSISVILLICNNAITQRFWLHYHSLSRLQSPLSLMDTHLLWPYESLEDYATWHKLLPFCKWVNLTHQDTFTHGPFDFVTINSQKNWDCISQPDWEVLKAHCDMFCNPLPRFDVPSFSIHVNCRVHVTFYSGTIAYWLIMLASHTNGMLLSPWQKVMASWANHPRFFLSFFTYKPIWRCLFWGVTYWGGHCCHPLCQRVRGVSKYWTQQQIFGIPFALLVFA